MMKEMKLQKNFLKSSLNRYQNNIEKLMKGSQFVFDYIYSLYYKCHEINLNIEDHL